MAVSVVLAAESVADELVAKIAERIPSIKVGAGSEPGNDMGPLITGEHRDKVRGYVDNAPAEGASVIVDGRDDVPADGFFLKPTLLDHVTTDMSCYRDEIFGPVLSVVRVSGYQQGIDTINANPYANGTAIFTRDGGAARQFQFDVQVGMVGVNVPVPVPVSYYSFGGWKASLFGDTHMYGPEGVNFYTRAKVGDEVRQAADEVAVIRGQGGFDNIDMRRDIGRQHFHRNLPAIGDTAPLIDVR